MMKKLHKFFILKASDRQVLIKAFILLNLIRLGLKLLPFKRLRGIFSSLIHYKRKNQNFHPSLNQIIWAINQASWITPGEVKCLARALTAEVILLEFGYSPKLRIGVAKGNLGQLEAHAWIEHQGKVVIGNLNDLKRYTPMPSL